MAKTNKERKELKEKTKKSEEKRRKKKQLVAKLIFVGVYILSIVICLIAAAIMSKDMAETAASLTVIFLVAIICILVMMFGNTKYPYRGYMEVTWSFSEFGIVFLAVLIILNFALTFIVV